MRRTTVLLLYTTLAAADYTNFYFNSSNGCPGLGIGCTAPESMCAYDSVNDKYYCCSGSSYDICRAFAATCEGSDGGPSTSQQECTSGSSSWCCLGSGSERCTSRTGQINVCVATQDNPIANVPDLLMNETFSSLSSASPSATSYSVDVTSLAERATAVSTTSSSTTSSAATTTTSTGPTSATANPDGGSTPTGAIAGGVVGGVAVLAIIGGMIWFFCARKRKGKSEQPPASPTTAEKHEDQFGFASPASGVRTPAPQYQLAEMEGTRELGEMPGSGGEEGKRLMGGHHVSEMPAGQDGVRELPG